eukprot:1734336-Amphidinium_carterae.1
MSQQSSKTFNGNWMNSEKKSTHMLEQTEELARGSEGQLYEQSDFSCEGASVRSWIQFVFPPSDGEGNLGTLTDCQWSGSVVVGGTSWRAFSKDPADCQPHSIVGSVRKMHLWRKMFGVPQGTPTSLLISLDGWIGSNPHVKSYDQQWKMNKCQQVRHKGPQT